MNSKLDVFKAAADFAKADQAYVTRIHNVLHSGNGAQKGWSVPSPEELADLQRLRAMRDEAENRFFALWVGDGWPA